MTTTIYQIDSFTSEPFAGNPAGVCLLDTMPADDWLANVAAEMNLSETAFLVPNSEGYHLRWFTPAVEVDLCGHATLASAKVLQQLGNLTEDNPVYFETLSGTLSARLVGNQIELDFPSTPPTSCDAEQDLVEGIQVAPVWCGKTRFDYLVEVENENAVRECQPNFEKLKAFGVRGVMITAQSDDSKFDFVSRFFAPGAGIDEDPVTGSAHCALAPYWQDKLGKSTLMGYQASKRGGVVEMVIDNDRVRLRGDAVMVMKCQLMV